MKKLLTLLFAVVLLTTGVQAKKKHHEKYYQTAMCDQMHGIMEYRLPDKTRVDCLTDEYAIEVDFAKKWAESIGQSLYYGLSTGKKPAVGLIIRNKKDRKYLRRLMKVAGHHDIVVFIIELK